MPTSPIHGCVRLRCDRLSNSWLRRPGTGNWHWHWHSNECHHRHRPKRCMIDHYEPRTRNCGLLSAIRSIYHCPEGAHCFFDDGSPSHSLVPRSHGPLGPAMACNGATYYLLPFGHCESVYSCRATGSSHSRYIGFFWPVLLLAMGALLSSFLFFAARLSYSPAIK